MADPLPSQTDIALQSVCQLAANTLSQALAIWLPEKRNQPFIIQRVIGLPKKYKNKATAIEGDGSTISKVIESNKRNLIANIFKSGLPPYYQLLRKTGYNAVLAVPILLKERTIGVIELFGSNTDELKRIDKKILQSICSIISIAVDGEHRSDQTIKLAEFTRRLSAEIGLQPAMQIIADGARELTLAHSTTIVLFEKKSNKFLVRTSSVSNKQQALPPEPRAKEGLTRFIYDSGQTINIPDTRKDNRVQKEVIDAGVRSLIGVQVKRGNHIVGVLWVNGSKPNYFTLADVQLLNTLAAQVSLAMQWASGFLAPASNIERVTLNLYQSKQHVVAICKQLKKEFAFDYAAVQLIRPDERIIETVYGTDIAEKYTGLAKHPLDRDPEFQDIQAFVATQKPPRIEIISGWDPRFNRWIYNAYHHENLVRAWVPILICRDIHGKVLHNWMDQCSWKLVKSELDADGARQSYQLQLTPDKDGNLPNVTCIGTIDAGFIDPETRISQQQATRMVAIVSRWALEMRKAQLPFILETIANNVQILLKDSTTGLYFCQTGKDHYAYEICSATQSACAVSEYRSFLLDIESQVIKTNKPLIIPQPGDPHASTLEEKLPELYQSGVRTIAVFPLVIDKKDATKQGILYIYFHKTYLFTEDEITWAKTFAGWAKDAIQHATYYMQSRDSTIRLNSLNDIAQSLVKEPEKTQDLLSRIAGNTLSILAADVVSIYEYIAAQDVFPKPPDIVGRLRDDNLILEPTDDDAPPTKLIRHGKNVYPPESFDILNERSGKNRKGLSNFVTREAVKATAGLLLKSGEEIVGVMFVNFRTPHRCTEEEIRTMNILASSAAIAIQTKRAYQSVSKDLERRKQELLALRAIEQAIGAGRAKFPNLARIYNLILDKALEITGAHHGAILHYDKNNKTLTVENFHGKRINIDGYYTQPIGYGITGLAAAKQESILLTDTANNEYAVYYNPVITNTKSELAVPILDDDGLVGIINIEHPEVGGLCENDKMFVEMLALQAVISRHSIDLYNKYKRQIKPRHSLNVIYQHIQNRPFLLDIALYQLLTGITSGEGLGLSRAVLFEIENNKITGKMAIGALSQQLAQETWFHIERQNKADKQENPDIDMLDTLLKRHEEHRRAILENQTTPSKLEQAVNKINLTMDNAYGGALMDCIKQRHTVLVDYDAKDPFRITVQQFTDKDPECDHPFACVPLVAGRTIYGVIYVDNCFLGETVERNKYLFDIDGLENYAAVAALMMKTNALLKRTQKKKETHQAGSAE